MGGREGKRAMARPALSAAGKLLAVLVLLVYEDVVVLLWPGGPLADPAAFAVILLADLAIGLDVFIRPGASTWKKKDEYPTWKVIAFFVASPLFLGLPWAERALLSTSWLPSGALGILSILGGILVAAGGVLLVWSRLKLGRLGTPKIYLQEDHRLVTTGPYRWLRNPMYSADLLLYGGVAIALGAPASLVFSVLTLLPLLLERARLEERLLEERFGEEYRDWARRSWRLVPFVW